MKAFGWTLVVTVPVLGMLALAACIPATASAVSGPVNSGGFRHERYDFGIAPLAQSQVMGSDWQLDNYFVETATAPSGNQTTRWQEKSGPAYRVTFHLDRDGDGTYETKQKESAYLIRFVSRSSQGVVALRALPISPTLSGHSLSSLLQSYVEEMSGAGVDLVWLAENKALVSREKRYATTVVKAASGLLAKQEAAEAIIDIANLDQLRLDPNHRFRRLHLVLARSPFQHNISDWKGVAPTSFPVLVLAVHVNEPTSFASSEKEYLDLLNRVTMAGQSGFESAVVEKPGTPASPPSAGSALPTEAPGAGGSGAASPSASAASGSTAPDSD